MSSIPVRQVKVIILMLACLGGIGRAGLLLGEQSPGAVTHEVVPIVFGGGAIVDTLHGDSQTFFQDLARIIPDNGWCIAPNPNQASVFEESFQFLEDLLLASDHYQWFHKVHYGSKEIFYSMLPFIYLVDEDDFKGMLVDLLLTADVDKLSLIDYTGHKFVVRQFYLTAFRNDPFLMVYFEDSLLKDPIILMRRGMLEGMHAKDMFAFYDSLYVDCRNVETVNP